MASFNETPSSMRMHISVFGRTNSGKSSLINRLAGQQVSLVSEVSGTTTDPVSKTMELYPLGPCVLTDTAGFSDQTELGKLRTDRTRGVVTDTDLAILVIAPGGDLAEEKKWLSVLKEQRIPTVLAFNKADLPEAETALRRAEEALEEKGKLLPVSAKTGQGMEALKSALVQAAPKDFELPSLTGHLVSPGDSVLLVMPQDIQAPKGRLILPQVQTIRDLLDNGALVNCVTTDKLAEGLAALKEPPALIITDSQAFREVSALRPAASRLTSFSALQARYKGDIDEFIRGAAAVDTLRETDRVLIAEACTHNPMDGDIGRVKIPALLRKKAGPGLAIDVVSGSDFPEDLSPYALVIHCGGCMFGRRYLLNRIRSAKEAQVPITNYGIFLAKMTGILQKIVV